MIPDTPHCRAALRSAVGAGDQVQSKPGSGSGHGAGTWRQINASTAIVPGGVSAVVVGCGGCGGGA
jgi:hypothetical protein